MLHAGTSKTCSLWYMYIAAPNDPHFQNEKIHRDLVHQKEYTSNVQCNGSPDKDKDINQPYHVTIQFKLVV